MIKFRPNKTQLRVMQVTATYIVEGTPECDLIDASGLIYKGCSIMSIGGESFETFNAPPPETDVVTIQQGSGTPYILGALSSEQNYQEEIELTSAGEYPEQIIGLDHSQLQSSGARIVAGDDALYLEPRVRVQGSLQVSSGGAPAQRIAVAEPVISSLEAYQASINQMSQILDNLGSTIAAIKAALIIDIPALATGSLAAVPTPITPAPTAPDPLPEIRSEIAEIER